MEYKMNYYQSLDINNKIFILENQICKLLKIYDNYWDDFNYYTDNYVMEDLSDEDDVLDEIIYTIEEKIEKVVNLLRQKKLKLKLIKKHYESL